MSEVESQVTETAPVTTEATTTTTAPAVETASTNTEGTEIGNGDAAAPAYIPDYKFSAYGEQGEIEETWRQYIKDKQTEENFKKLYSKAHAFEKNHEKLERTRGEFQKTQSELQKYEQGLEELRGYVGQKDFESFFKRMNIPMAAVWEWVNDKVNYQELSPEQKMRYDEAMRIKRENLELQNKYKSADETSNQMLSRLANMELDMALSKPEYRDYQERYDAKKGRRGAFRDFVIDRGAAIESRTKKDCHVEDAIKDALEWLDFGSETQESHQGQPLVARSSNKPVIPNIKGGGVAPVKKRPSNLKELRADIERRQLANS